MISFFCIVCAANGDNDQSKTHNTELHIPQVKPARGGGRGRGGHGGDRRGGGAGRGRGESNPQCPTFPLPPGSMLWNYNTQPQHHDTSYRNPHLSNTDYSTSVISWGNKQSFSTPTNITPQEAVTFTVPTPSVQMMSLEQQQQQPFFQFSSSQPNTFPIQQLNDDMQYVSDLISTHPELQSMFCLNPERLSVE